MMKRLTWTLSILLTCTALAACDDGGSDDPGTDTSVADATTTGGDTSMTTGTMADTNETTGGDTTMTTGGDTTTTTGGDTSTTTGGDTMAETVEPECASNDECTDATMPYCNTESGTCEPAPAGGLIGWGDGSTGSVTLTEIYQGVGNWEGEATGLDFHPTRDELWVMYRPFEVEGECTDAFGPRCYALASWTANLGAPGTADQTISLKQDENAWHFMRRAPGLAMGAADTFGTCGEAATGNFEDNDVMFIGATLWSSDPAIYAEFGQAQGVNGSHLDMLHATPWCTGIAHEVDNVYWLFNGHVGSIDRYDFNDDHGPGNDDHSDGTIFRYAEGEFSRIPNVMSHMEFNPDNAMLYIADPGNGRVAMLDTTSGEKGGQFQPVYEVLQEWASMTNVSVSDFVPSGTIQQPSGLAIDHDADVVYVGDRATGIIHAFDLEGNELRTLDTGMTTLAGLAIGKGALWFTDMSTGTVYRVDP